ncbi:hypothetical protein BG74_06955 [Sodalis-like endosymbiont of Proechinophthirus fluctus]|nr:hypothetical protein BG74_06955 [Sodalis-like endosymbiont of Proechinophthirus fluctus]
MARSIAIFLATTKEKIIGEVFNIGDNKLNISLSRLGNFICSCIHGIIVKSDESIIDNRSYRVDFSSIRNKVWFTDKYDLNKNIK